MVQSAMNYLRRRRAELRLGMRIAVAGLSSFALAHAIGLAQGYWAVFTGVLVVQTSVGGSFKAALDRLIGTISGAVYGAAVAILVPHTDVFALGAALAISLVPLALLAALNSSFRVAPVTAVILLLGSTGASEGPVLAALDRTFEVTLGGLVGVVVSMFILPARAHTVMGDAAKRVCGLMAALTAEIFAGLTGRFDAATLSVRHDAIQAAFDKLETAAQEAERERRALLTGDSDPDPIPRTLRRVYHDLVLIGRIAAEPLVSDARERLSPPLARLSSAIESLLRETGEAFAERRAPPPLLGFDNALAECLADIDAAPADGRLIALRFAFEQIRRNLTDLAARATEFARATKKQPATV
jgi:uncharacterized membrane protein YccC